MKNQSIKEVLDQLVAINNELLTSKPPQLKPHSIEDWDDLAQARLEYSWWKREKEDEFKDLVNTLEVLIN